MDSKRFQRTIEDFTCEKCGADVKGTGYTNHCPKCLWSKHIDVNPGDRAESCQGAMEPMGIETVGGEYYITHICSICGIKRKIRSSKDDDFEELLRIARGSHGK